MELTPIFRIEKFLDAIINSTTPPEPMFRVEYFLAKIAGADVVTPDPVFRIEKYLAKILGEDVEIPEPMFRTEFWLAKKCGEDVETPDPAFRVEYWLEEWCGGSAPTYETITGKIVSFLTQRIAPLKIEADLSPIQDLHGQEAPWPPGGGKNLLNNQGTSATVSNVAYTVNADGSVSTNGASNGWNGFSLGSQTLPAGTYILSSGVNEANRYNQYVSITVDGKTIETSSGSEKQFTLSEEATFTPKIFTRPGYAPNQTVYPMIRLSSVSDATFAPYSNICPISGHTGCEVVRTGKNLCGGLDFAQSFSGANGYALDTDAKTVKFKRGSANGITLFPWMRFKENTQYQICFSFLTASNNTCFSCVYTNGETESFTLNSAEKTTVWKSTAAGKTVDHFFIGWKQTGEVTCYYDESGIFEYDENPTFEPYSGTTVSITFGSTVYGGTLTVNEDGTGSVVATDAMVAPPVGYRHGTSSAGIPYVDVNCTGLQQNAQFISSSYKRINTGDNLRDGAIRAYNNEFTIYDNRFTDLQTANTLLEDVQILYKLATPITIPLTPGQVEALQGNNTVWVDDSGEIKVTYRSN